MSPEAFPSIGIKSSFEFTPPLSKLLCANTVIVFVLEEVSIKEELSAMDYLQLLGQLAQVPHPFLQAKHFSVLWQDHQRHLAGVLGYVVTRLKTLQYRSKCPYRFFSYGFGKFVIPFWPVSIPFDHH